eukprot:TRINITY_DN9199_c0_g10_i1.p2 TRINITY_DN9199_c0_g10~~TRINITY_DN9199_c0_g10_i1.p2  ORF type:complete len:115 (+),score=11.02 TRINITY_DN9199_c0_g10_i1:904-1248(+)
MQLILHKETKKLQKCYTEFAYYTSRLLEETRLLTVKHYRKARKQFISAASKSIELGNTLNNEWRLVIENLDVKLSGLTKEERSDLLLELNSKLGIQSEFTKILLCLLHSSTCCL